MSWPGKSEEAEEGAKVTRHSVTACSWLSGNSLFVTDLHVTFYLRTGAAQIPDKKCQSNTSQKTDISQPDS